MQIQKDETSHQQDVSSLHTEVSELSSSMQNLFTTLDAHLHAVEDQSTEIAKKLQAEKTWKSSCASKVNNQRRDTHMLSLPVKLIKPSSYEMMTILPVKLTAYCTESTCLQFYISCTHPRFITQGLSCQCFA